MNTNAAARRENHRSVRHALRPAVLLVCLAVLSGAACGQRGPLYLPAQEPPLSGAPTESAPPDTAPVEAVDPEDEDVKDENAEETGRN